MTQDAISLITSLGGYRRVALRLGAEPKTLHGHMMRGDFPAKFYWPLVQLAVETGMPPPPAGLFRFADLRPPLASESGDGVAA